MSDNDLTRRGNAKRELYREWCESHEAGVVDYQCALDRVPAVPHEMTAREFLKARNRLCTSFESGACSECPLYAWCGDDEVIWSEKLLAIVENWAREHPERSEEE